MREAGLETDDIEVINPITGSTEYISKDDPSYYDSSGFKGRRYKGSSKPKDIPTFLWRGASKAARERAKREALLKEATEKNMMQPLPKNASITGLLIVLPLQLYLNPKRKSNLPMISFPQCQSSPVRGARMVETIATETSFRISQSSCAFTFPTHSWPDPLDRRRSTTLLLPKLHSIRNGITLLVRVHGIIPLSGNGMMFQGKLSRTKPKFM